MFVNAHPNPSWGVKLWLTAVNLTLPTTSGRFVDCIVSRTSSFFWIFYTRSSTFHLLTQKIPALTDIKHTSCFHTPDIKFYSCYLASLFEGISSIRDWDSQKLCEYLHLYSEGPPVWWYLTALWRSPQMWAEGQLRLRFKPVSLSYTQSYCWLNNRKNTVVWWRAVMI